MTISAAAGPAAGQHVAALNHIAPAATISLAYGVSRTVRRRPSGCHYSCDSTPCRRGGIGHNLPRPRHKHGYPGGSCGHRDGERGAGGRGLRTRGRGGLIVLSSIGLGVQRGLGVRETARTTGRKLRGLGFRTTFTTLGFSDFANKIPNSLVTLHLKLQIMC